MSKESHDPKYEMLRQYGALNAATDAVRDECFLSHEFFDLRDLVQVKYEMLRRVRIDGASVSQAARDFGFSRTVYYQALALLEEQGLPGLIPKRPGPKGAHKLNDAVLEFIQEQQHGADEPLRLEALAKMIGKQFAISIHPRSIERALARRRKKGL
ncbi:MAG: helix-turn-helix domain-containing protein [Sphingomonadaceae bacterium]|nr:helix-turn-helix domain-containing protein [Fuerstiella sp.]